MPFFAFIASRIVQSQQAMIAKDAEIQKIKQSQQDALHEAVAPQSQQAMIAKDAEIQKIKQSQQDAAISTMREVSSPDH